MKKRLLIVLMLAFLGSFLIGQSLAQERNVKVVVKTLDGKRLPLYNASYALVVGVSAYTNGWPILPQAVNDAREIRTALEQHGFVVTPLENPTSAQLENAIKEFIATRGLGAENRLLFYFAGHGYTQKKAYGADMGYIVPSDAPLPGKDQTGFLRKAISMENFNSYAREINAKHVLFLFDSCFSGSIFALARAVPAAITYKTSEPVRQFITAGAANETVPDKSIFKQQFLVALAGEGDSNKDGYVTANELGGFLQTKVINYSRNTQHPQYGKIRDSRLDKGDFVFIVPLALPPETKFDPSQYEIEANRLTAAKAQWKKWQSEMSASFQKVQNLDHSTNLEAASKAQMWQDFLNSYAKDNPYSQEDDAIRREANSRRNFWRTYLQPEMEPTTTALASSDSDMVLIPAGTFMMGSNNGSSNEKPVHQVYVGAFYMDKYEVTVERFKNFVETTGYKTDAEKDGWSYEWVGTTWEKKQGINWRHDPNGGIAGSNHPVIYVSWNDAVAFCEWLSKTRNARVRLPTEAEWEYAARSGNKGYKFAWGNDYPYGKKGGNIADESAKDVFTSWWEGYDDGYIYTAPVGSFGRNEFGLYDMTGNVWEWCSDWYASDYYQNSPKQNPKGPFTAISRVMRGGSWDNIPNNVRCAHRGWGIPPYRINYVGFRCVQDLRQTSSKK